MKQLLLLIFIAICLLKANTIIGCTSFCIKGNNQILLCKNLDWDFDFGYIEINKRGLNKKAYVDKNEKAIEWTSKYGNITFNHIGKEFPLGGMNEAGLVIEEMNYYWTKYPKPDKRPTINELQWIQYQLDNFSTVDEVIKSDKILRISGDIFKLHYLICDKKGNIATIEFLNGTMVVHTNDNLKVPVLTNHRYDESVDALKNYKGFGGNDDIPQEYESLMNFIRVSSLIQNYTNDISILDYSFKILQSASTNDTQWSIAYDISNSMIYFRTRQYNKIKKIDLNKFSFSCNSSSLLIDVNTNEDGEINDRFVNYDSNINEQHLQQVYKSYNNLRFVEKDSIYFKEVGEYPKRIECKIK